MSKEISSLVNTGGKLHSELTFNQFYMGDKLGLGIQLTQGQGGQTVPGYIQLSVKDAYLTVQELTKWIQSVCDDKAKEIEEQIKINKELQKTILQDAVKCNKFIQDLEMIKIPLLLLGN